jgi:hypothetical protein
MESLTVGQLTFRWADEGLLVVTPAGQYLLDGKETIELLDYLYSSRDSMWQAAHRLPDWAQPPKLRGHLHQEERPVYDTRGPDDSGGGDEPLIE